MWVPVLRILALLIVHCSSGSRQSSMSAAQTMSGACNMVAIRWRIAEHAFRITGAL
jgi:hypothetical protein